MIILLIKVNVKRGTENEERNFFVDRYSFIVYRLSLVVYRLLVERKTLSARGFLATTGGVKILAR